MKLRNADLAVVERQKLVDHLLNASHTERLERATSMTRSTRKRLMRLEW